MMRGSLWAPVIGTLMAVAALLAACGKKESAVEGKLVYWDREPVAGVKVVAAQVQPIKGYEQAEAVTGPDGAFRLTGLYPTSTYVLKPWSDKWTTEAAVAVQTAPQGETRLLREPLLIPPVCSLSGSLVVNLATGATRFTVTPEGVIIDGKTGLEWVAGPDRDTNFKGAREWVSNFSLAGGGWRMPTRQELATLYHKGVGERNMDPAFRTSGWWVWAEPRDSSSAWLFYFGFGQEDARPRRAFSSHRAFAVRGFQR